MYLFIPFSEYPSLARAVAVDLSCDTISLYARTSACPSELCSRSAPVGVNGVQAASVVLLARRFARSWTHLDGSPVGAEFSMLVDHALLASKRGMKPGKHGRKKVSARKDRREARARRSGSARSGGKVALRLSDQKRRLNSASVRRLFLSLLSTHTHLIPACQNRPIQLGSNHVDL